MEFKHTPAPWLIEERDINGKWDDKYFGIQTMEIDSCEYMYLLDSTVVGYEQSLANAHLIAAAPELLEALIEMQRNGRKQGWNDIYESSMEKTRLAIAKALGQQ
ncbi:hypothetical protein J6836_00510 [Providencia sp. R33]|uniref:hypothetical protein n=1 Tax=Providencia sp. R33 TaxID=2828763 RepID=UPI001C5AE19B|nr:hypothetical protein [Providencia sp. R33]QXX82910.1 hypothetical protein J6836_00510 [Providencia sp. R33]